jgi:hypothetical protein
MHFIAILYICLQCEVVQCHAKSTFFFLSIHNEEEQEIDQYTSHTCASQGYCTVVLSFAFWVETAELH